MYDFYHLLTSLLFLLPIVSSQSTNTSSSAVFVYDASTAFQYVFALTIDSTTNDTYIFISGPNTDAWLGFGFGQTMQDSLMLITYISSSGNDLTLSPRRGPSHVEPSYDPNITCTSTAPGSTIDNNAGTMSGYWKCASLPLPISNTTITTTPMIFAIGPPSLPMSTSSLTAPLRMHSFHGTFTIDLTSAISPHASSPTPNGPFNSWWTSHASMAMDTQADSDRIPPAHGLLMLGTFVFVFPLGSLILRLRNFVRAHAFVQVCGMVFVMMGLGLGVRVSVMYNRSKRFDSAHQVIGFLVLGALCLQVVLGWAGHRRYKDIGKRSALSRAHFVLGPVVMALGVVNGGIGLQFAGNPWNDFQYYICIVVAVALLFSAARATCYCLARRRKRRDAPEAQEETGYQYPQFGHDAPPMYGSPQAVPLQTFFPPPPQQKSNVIMHTARVG